MTTPFDDLTTISAIEFVSRLKHCLTKHKQRVTWFLGSGCSVSSGIPTASGLVEMWSRELRNMQRETSPLAEDSNNDPFHSFPPDSSNKDYAKVFSQRHPSPLDRQREIEMICSNGEPGYGYATFAQLISHPKVGHLCNTVLTTNFDDLVADALHIYGAPQSRPQVISHEALTHFARLTSPRPTVIKLHGDAHIDPKNTEPETTGLEDNVRQHLYPFLNESALVFIGYGGNDQSIAKFLDEHSAPALSPQIYWVGKESPSSDLLCKWMTTRNTLRVDHRDFDRLMHLIRRAFDINQPDMEERWKAISKAYKTQFNQFNKEIENVADAAEKKALEKATEETGGSLGDIWVLLFEARRLETDDPDEAQKLYERAIEIEPENITALNNFALFLEHTRKNADKAEKFYTRAIEAESENATALNNFALFQENILKDACKAEKFYTRAIEAESEDATILNNFAVFVANIQKDTHKAAHLFKRAVAADADDHVPIVSYALFVLASDHSDEGAKLLDRVVPSQLPPRFAARFHFARYTHIAEEAENALAAMKPLILDAKPSPYFDPSANIARAESDGHPNVPLLRDLARVLRGEATVKSLDKHVTWKNLTNSTNDPSPTKQKSKSSRPTKPKKAPRKKRSSRPQTRKRPL